MRFSFPTLVASIGLLFAATAYATEEAAESCLTDKIWAGYSDGWAVRTGSFWGLLAGGFANGTCGASVALSRSAVRPEDLAG